MTYFHIKIDNKFDELICKMKNRKLNLNDIIDLKEFIFDIYSSENEIIDDSIVDGFREIDISHRLR
jgi:hypothetical protein